MLKEHEAAGYAARAGGRDHGGHVYRWRRGSRLLFDKDTQTRKHR
jgi:hypothetical protein